MNEPALRDVFGDFLEENGEKFRDIVVLNADLSLSTRTAKFAKKFPNRFFNMGIAEQNMLGTALGFAISGKKPIVSGFSIFTTGRAWEFIRIACHDKLNLKIITTHGGFVGEDGSTHHALEDLSLMSTLANLTILVPSDNLELIQMLDFALNEDGPFYIRLPRGSFPQLHNNDYHFNIEKINVIKDGYDICLIGIGYGSILGMSSVPVIEKKLGISMKVINLCTVKPLNKIALLKELKTVKGIVVVEEHNIYCGVGSILARIISTKISTPMRFVGIENSYGQSGDRESLLNYYGLNKENILKQVSDLINIK